MATRTYSAAAALTLALLAWGAVVAAGAVDHELARFERRVFEYAELHRRIAAAFPPPRLSGDGEEVMRATGALFEAMKAARPGAVAGDVFDAAASDVIRAAIGGVIAQHDYDAALMLRAVGHAHGHRRAVVNERFPWAVNEVMWPSVVRSLPVLPPELEYRFIGRDLVLLDVDADLVVDVLPEALPLS